MNRIEVDISRVTDHSLVGQRESLSARVRHWQSMRKWLNEKEIKYERKYSNPSNYFPTAIAFLNREDALAFKLTFQV